MIIPRVGAIILLGGFGYAFVTYARVAYITGVEGYMSWAWVLLFLLPSGGLGIASSLWVLRREERGRRLVMPFAAVTVVSALLALAGAPPVGGFLDDYKDASHERGITVPPYERSKGLTKTEYIDAQAGDLKLTGSLTAIGAAALYAFMARRGPRRPEQAAARQPVARAAR